MIYILLALISFSAFFLGPLVSIGAIVFAFYVSERTPLMLSGLTLFTIAAIGLETTLISPEGGWLLAGLAAFCATTFPGALKEHLKMLLTIALYGGLGLAITSFFIPLNTQWIASLLAIGVFGGILINWRLIIETHPLRTLALILPTLSGIGLGYLSGSYGYAIAMIAGTGILLFTPNRISALMALGGALMGLLMGGLMAPDVSFSSYSLDPLTQQALIGGISLLSILGIWRLSHHGWQSRTTGWATLLFLLPLLPLLQGPALVIAGMILGLIISSVPYDTTSLADDPILKTVRAQKEFPKQPSHPDPQECETPTSPQNTEKKHPPALNTSIGVINKTRHSFRAEPPLEKLAEQEKQPT